MAINFPSSPTTGQTLQSGNQVWTYNGTAWTSGYANSAYVRQTFTATGSQTVFAVSGGYQVGLVDVYQNGVKLVNGVDVTVTSGSNVVLAVGATAGDVIEVLGLSSVGGLNYLPLTGGTLTGTVTGTVINANQVNLAAGTSSVSPLDFTAGPVLTTALAGAFEYDGVSFYGTPLGVQRGLIAAPQFFRLNSSLVGANVTSAQNALGVGVSLSTNTAYAFEGSFLLSKTAGVTSHSVLFGFGGTATTSSIGWQAYGSSSTVAALGTVNMGAVYGVSTAAVQVIGTTTAATNLCSILVRGTIAVSAAGTLIPQYTLSAAPGGAYTTMAGSYFSIYPVGGTAANTSIGTWA